MDRQSIALLTPEEVRQREAERMRQAASAPTHWEGDSIIIDITRRMRLLPVGER